MSIPLPPSVNISVDVAKEGADKTVTTILETPKESGELNADESNFIMQDTLHAKHLNDPKVIEFIDSFVHCKNVLQASAECGIHVSLGRKWRNRKDIANCISKLIAKSAVKHGFDASEVLERAKEIADSDPIHLQNRDGSYRSNLHEIPAEARRCLKKLKVKNLYQDVEDINGIKKKIIVGEIIEYEFYDKIKAIDLVGKEKDMFKNTTKVEHTVTKDMASILLASTKRAEKAIEDKHSVVDAEFKEKNEKD